MLKRLQCLLIGHKSDVVKWSHLEWNYAIHNRCKRCGKEWADAQS